MDIYEKVGYSCLALVGVCYLVAMIIGTIAAFPLGLVGLLALLGVGILVIKVVRDRQANKEDDYYADNVEK